MKYLVLLMLLLTSCGLSEQECLDIAMDQSEDYIKIGHDQGLDICDIERKKLIEQFRPKDQCLFVQTDNYTIKAICKSNDLELYNEIIK